MFVKNTSLAPVALARGHFFDGIFVAALVATVPYRITSLGLEPWDGPRPELPTDPPSSTDKPLWEGASVTAAGSVFAPGCFPHATRVALRVGEQSRSLRVWGERRWVKNAGKLVASAAAPWESLPLSWERAFGGTVEIPPGPIGPNKLPHPGGRLQHPMNPRGMGLCLDPNTAEGIALPNIESETESMKQPIEQPRPAGFAPCPDLAALRMPDGPPPNATEDPEGFVRAALRVAHAAPGELIFPALPEGTPIELTGVGRTALRLEVPRCPIRVAVRKGRALTPLAAAVRSIHLSGDDGAALVTFGHPFCYEVAPSWVEVAAA